MDIEFIVFGVLLIIASFLIEIFPEVFNLGLTIGMGLGILIIGVFLKQGAGE